MTDAKRALLDHLIRYANNCKSHRGKLDAKTLRDYMGIGGFTFLDGIVSHDGKGIKYESFERNGNLKFDISYSGVIEHIEKGHHEQLTLF